MGPYLSLGRFGLRDGGFPLDRQSLATGLYPDRFGCAGFDLGDVARWPCYGGDRPGRRWVDPAVARLLPVAMAETKMDG